MTVSAAIGAAATFVWLGMVVAISFIEAPLKFRAAGVTVPIGLGIGQLVFRALNIAEALLAGVIVIAVATGRPPVGVLVAVTVAVVVLIVQLVGVRPRLARRSRAVLAGQDAPRSRAHHAYVALEVVKVFALVAAGVAFLS
ncbi:hypothetical protein JRC04_13160 [Mycolicibacterium sp. S2-37]|uniref:hypothetical protein n=1 Tax=Mycolicibacterium sp. S2-37 TaxID=2810297 RepID=UPI001A944310|nr:hypothetical protein [Mycolicibacterium sp. S2-37]MBO0678412.1 hypothetical protein [Mycolicibacterium sp. S2-37]